MRAATTNLEQLTADRVLVARAVAVTDGCAAVEIWRNPSAGLLDDSPALLVPVSELLPQYVIPVRRRLMDIGLSEGLQPPGIMGV